MHLFLCRSSTASAGEFYYPRRRSSHVHGGDVDALAPNGECSSSTVAMVSVLGKGSEVMRAIPVFTLSARVRSARTSDTSSSHIVNAS